MSTIEEITNLSQNPTISIFTTRLSNVPPLRNLETDVDPLEACPDISYLNEEDMMLQFLKVKISQLEKRVESLEKQNSHDLANSKYGEGEKKKIRRRFTELNRNFKVHAYDKIVPSCRMCKKLRF